MFVDRSAVRCSRTAFEPRSAPQWRRGWEIVYDGNVRQPREGLTGVGLAAPDQVCSLSRGGCQPLCGEMLSNCVRIPVRR